MTLKTVPIFDAQTDQVYLDYEIDVVLCNLLVMQYNLAQKYADLFFSLKG